MKDWKSIAAAAGVNIDERSITTLAGLEKSFAPLTVRLLPDDDLAVEYAAALPEDAE